MDFRADTVLFDLDGTLTDSAPGIIAGFRHALDTVGAPEPTPEMLSRVIGPPLIDSFHSFGFDDDRTQRALAAYVARYDERGWAENTVYEGITSVLDGLAEAGTTMAVATSKNEKFATRILDHFELSHYFEFIAGASDDGSRRAKADVIARALGEVGKTPTAATDGGTPAVVMVGDREHDVYGAAQWGIPAVLVEWGYGHPSEHADARWTVTSMLELSKVLDDVTV
jgi:phosphoglycolate phosphatase